MSESIADVAKRCLEDKDYARSVYEGEEYPEVRAAILADFLAEVGETDDAEVKGYLNPCPLPPVASYRISSIWNQWNISPRVNLISLTSFNTINFHSTSF